MIPFYRAIPNFTQRSKTYRAEEWYVVLFGATLAVGHPFDAPPPSASPLRSRACVCGCACVSRVSLRVRGTLIDARSGRGGHSQFRVDGMLPSLHTVPWPLCLVKDVDDDVNVGTLNRRRTPTITHCWSDDTQTARRRLSRKRLTPSIKFRMLEIPLTRKIPRYVAMLHGFRVTQPFVSPWNIVEQFFFFYLSNKSK